MARLLDFDTFPMGLLVLLGLLIIYSQVHLRIIDHTDHAQRRRCKSPLIDAESVHVSLSPRVLSPKDASPRGPLPSDTAVGSYVYAKY